MPRSSGFSPRTTPNFVATTTRSRRSRIAFPTSSSFLNGPYMSAVSRKVAPSSIARSICASHEFPAFVCLVDSAVQIENVMLLSGAMSIPERGPELLSARVRWSVVVGGSTYLIDLHVTDGVPKVYLQGRPIQHRESF